VALGSTCLVLWARRGTRALERPPGCLNQVETQAVKDKPEVTGSSDPHLMPGLTGRPLPALSLPSTTGSDVDLIEAYRAILYFYPGAHWAPEGGFDSRALDEAQHRAFADHWDDLLGLGCNAFGVSTQASAQQRVTAAALGIGHPLLCDSDRRLARELGLPTFGIDDASWYARATLVVNDGVIAQAFYPVTSATKSPAQAIAWMRRQRWA
jgi:peroxiredoxin